MPVAEGGVGGLEVEQEGGEGGQGGEEHEQRGGGEEDGLTGMAARPLSR